MLHGVIIGFEPFKQLPTVIVACANVEYSEAKIEFIYFNAQSKGVELVAAMDDDIADIDKNEFVRKLDSEIAKKRNEITDLEDRKRYFLEKFKCYWSKVDESDQEEDAATEGVEEASS